jgi:hypothetical protein
VRLFDKPLYRFLVWAGTLVVVAAITGAIGLSWWLIVVCVFGAWVVLTIVERRLDRSSAAHRAEAPAEPPEPATSEAIAPEPAALEAAAPEPAAREFGRRRRFLPASRPESVPGPEPSVSLEEKQWSIWALDKVARENTDAELRYLVLSLQEYADTDGLLPLQFDPLVRESFGELLGIAATG